MNVTMIIDKNVEYDDCGCMTGAMTFELIDVYRS